MSEIKAFVGHSFTDDDKDVIRQFLEFFDHVKDMGIGFSWEHAEPAEPKILSQKVLKLMEDKNLFIGICTIKERAVALDKVKQIRLFKSFLKANIEDFSWKTSDWIIQEIGVAIGKNMDIIILLEGGLRKPGGLQGDLEYIEFNRSEPSKSFNKILEMLKALSPKKKVGYVSTVEVSEKIEEKIIEEEEDENLEPTTGWERTKYKYALFRAIAKDDTAQEQKIIKTYIDSEEGQKDSNKVSFEALKYYFRGLQGKGVHVEELKSMSSAHPDNSDISYYLGKAYEEYKDNDKAADQYEKSAECAQSPKEKLARFCDAAVVKCKAGIKDSEDWLLNKVRNLIADVDDGEFRLLTTLKNIAEIENNNDKCLAYSERMIDISPDDKNLRFSLAYKYSELKNNELAIFHYMLIPNKDRSSTTWNNIGVANAEIGINGKAVDAYRESEKMGETLAMSNLAHKFITAGFLKEAEEICGNAVKIENYNKQVGTAITSIKETKDNEDQRQKKILEDNEKRRRFYIDYGQVSIKHPPENHEAIWTGPECELNIEINGRSFIARGSYEKKELTSGLAAIYYVAPITQGEKIVKTNIRYEGIITGLGIEYKLYIKGEARPSLLTGLLSNGYSKEGLMIIDKDMQKIRVYEKGTKETEKYYELRRK